MSETIKETCKNKHKGMLTEYTYIPILSAFPGGQMYSLFKSKSKTQSTEINKYRARGGWGTPHVATEMIYWATV